MFCFKEKKRSVEYSCFRIDRRKMANYLIKNSGVIKPVAPMKKTVGYYTCKTYKCKFILNPVMIHLN